MNKCPNKSHSDWKYAVEKLGEDKTLFMYDRLGQEIPTKEQVDSLYGPIIMYDAVSKEEPVSDNNTERGSIGVNKNQLLLLLGPTMYSKPLAQVAVKELLQNSFDAIKAEHNINNSHDVPGIIDITFDEKNRTIQVVDDGIGMSKDTVKKAFLTIGGTFKEGLSTGERSGGFGLAKVQFLLGSEYVELETVHNGIKTIVKATSAQLYNDDFDITTEVTDKQNGTSVTIKIPASYTTPEGNVRNISFPYSTSSIEVLTKPLIGNVQIRSSFISKYGSGDNNMIIPDILPLGVNISEDMLPEQVGKVSFSWGEADIYMSINKEEYAKHRILSSGLYQFDHVFYSNNEKIPYNIVINIKPSVASGAEQYPFNNQREDFKPTIKKDIELLTEYLSSIYTAEQEKDIIETFKNIQSLPKTDPDKILTPEEKDKIFHSDLLSKIDRKIPEQRNLRRFFDIGISSSGIQKKNTTNEKEPDTSFKVEEGIKVNPVSALETNNIDQKQPQYHNNTNVDFSQIPGAIEFFSDFGSVVVDFVKFVGDNINRFERLSGTTAPFFAGISIDKNYHGVHLRRILDAIFINPLSFNASNIEGAVGKYMHTLIHEVVHNVAGRHDETFTSKLGIFYGEFYATGKAQYFEGLLRSVFKKHFETYKVLINEYDKRTTTNKNTSFETEENERTNIGDIRNNEDSISGRQDSSGTDIGSRGDNQTDKTGEIILDKIKGKYTPKKKSVRINSPSQVISKISETSSVEEIENILLGYKGIINSRRWEGKLWLKAMNESTLDHIGLFNELSLAVNAVYPGLISLDYKQEASLKAGRGIYEVVVDEYAWNKYINRNNDSNFKQGVLFKRNLIKERADLLAKEVEEIKDFFSSATDITNAYNYLNSAAEMLGNLSNEHKDLVGKIELIRKFFPELKVRQIYKSQLPEIFDTDEEVNEYKSALAFYSEGVIYIIKDQFYDESKSMLIGTIMHEIIHGFTLNIYWNRDKYQLGNSPEKQFLDNMLRLFLKAKARTKYKYHNAYEDLGEFLADGITDQKIIDELKTMWDEKEGLTFWQKVKQFILELLHLDKHPDSYHHQLLSSIMDFTYKTKGKHSGVSSVQARKIKDNININYSNPTHAAIVKTLSDTEDAYEQLPEKFDGVTAMMRRLCLGGVPYEMLSKETQEELDKYSGPGTETHFQIEKSFKSVIKDIEHKYKLTPSASEDLLRFFSKFNKPGVTILSEVKVFHWEEKMVGAIDLVVIDENNKVHFFDFKTKINGFENFDRDYFPKAGEPQYLPFSSYKQASMQLTAYANMWKSMTKLDVDTMTVIPIKPTVNQETKTIEKYELDKSFNGNDTIKIPRLDVWMPILYSAKAVTMKKDDYQDVINNAEQSQIIKESEVLWRKKLESLDTRTEEQELLLKIVKSLSNTIEVTRKSSGIQKFNEQIKWLNEILAEDDINKALSYAVDTAFKITKKAYDELEKFKKSGDIMSPTVIYRFRDTVSAFDILDEYEALLNIKKGLYDLKPLPKASKDKKSYDDYELLRSRLSRAIQYKNAVKSDYYRIGLELMADYLFPFYTKVKAEWKKDFGLEYRKLKRHKEHGDGILKTDKNYDILINLLQTFNSDITEKEYVNNRVNAEKDNIDKASKVMIRKELKKAARDITTLEAWIDNILDSPDSVTAALVKSFVMQDDTARIEIERERLNMLPTVREWEQYSSKYGKNYRKAYDDMIEVDLTTGKDTGYLVSKFHSSLIKEYRNILAITSSVMNEESRDAYMKIWKDINMPLDKVEFQKAYLGYIEHLEMTKKITEEERSKLVFEATKRSGKRMSYEDMAKKDYISDGTHGLIIEWLQKNTWKYRNPGDQWVNPQWLKLQNILQDENDPRTKMYNMLNNIQQRADDMVPSGVKLGARLPGIIKQKNERIASGQNLIDMAKGSLSKSLDFKVDDTHRVATEVIDLEGNAKYFVPTHFTGMVTKTIKENEKELEVFDPDEQSFDLANIYYNYIASAIDFNWKNNLLPEMELHKTLLRERDVVQRDAFSNIKYRASRIGKNSEKSELDEVTIKGGNISKQFDTWVLYALYGQAEKDLGVIPGTKIDAGKLIGNIQQFTALNLLGFNFMAGVANLGLGEVMQGIEAFAGKHIGLKEYHHAQMFYMRNLPGILGDIESRQPENIVSLLLREFNVLHDPKIKNLTDGRFAASMTSDTAFFTNHSGEHKMQATFMLATLERRRAYNSKGEDIGSMLSHYKVVDGKLKLDDEVSEIKSDWENFGRRTFEHYVRGLLGRIHGDYSDLARVAIQQNALMGMAYMFRKFIVPGFRRRWGAMRYEERTEEFVEGNYRTMMRFASNLIKSLRTQKALMLSREWALLSDSEKANIIRTIGEIIALITMIILANVAIKFAGDDDKTGDLAWNFIAYQALRLKSELLFFVSPPQAMKILRSPAASITIAENTMKLMIQLTGPGWEYYEQGPWEDHMKIQKTLIDMTIGVRQYYKLRDVGELVDMWKI